jgi:hypothetical protein
MKFLKKYFKLIYLGLLVLFLFSCNNKEIKFDKSKWDLQIDPLFPSSYRLKMLNDLTSNYKLVGFKHSQLIGLLGIPDSQDNNTLSYNIVVDYGHDIDPVYIKKLDFIFSKDSVIKSFKVYEWKKEQ